MKYVLAAGDGHKGGGGLWVPPGRYNSQIVYCPGALRPPPFPTLGQAWGTYVVCGCCRAGTIARANALTQIVPNLSSLYTLFYSVIYNSVVETQFWLRGTNIYLHLSISQKPFNMLLHCDLPHAQLWIVRTCCIKERLTEFSGFGISTFATNQLRNTLSPFLAVYLLNFLSRSVYP